MKCPNDESVLQMTDRSGIEIDYCPTCRGVWLDRGELDKIIERSGTATPTPEPTTQSAPSQRPTQPEYYDEPRRHDSYHKDDYYKKKRKKESFLGDLFDF